MEDLIVSIVGGTLVLALGAAAGRLRMVYRAMTEASAVVSGLVGDAVVAAAPADLRFDRRRWVRDSRGLARELERVTGDRGGDDQDRQREFEGWLRTALSGRRYGGLAPHDTLDADAFWRYFTDARLERLRHDLPSTAGRRERAAVDDLCALAGIVRREDVRALLVEIRRDMVAADRLPAYLPTDLDVTDLARPVMVRATLPDDPSDVSDVTDPGVALRPSKERVRRSEPASTTVSWSAVLRSAPRIVVLGQPGHGKSWLVRTETARLAQAAVDAIDGGGDLASVLVPVAVRCDELAATPGDSAADRLVTVLRHRFGEAGLPDRVFGWLAQRIAADHAAVFLDAWDELPGPDERRTVASVLAALPPADPSRPGRVIVTSRPADYAGAPMAGPVSEVELRPFTRRDVGEFIDAWGLAETTTRELRARLEDPRLESIARSPLLLSLLCLVADRHGTLPTSRWALYERVVDEFAMRDRALPSVAAAATDPVSHSRLLRTLGQIATAFATRPEGWVDEMPLDDVREAIERSGSPGVGADDQIAAMTRSGLVTVTRAWLGGRPSYRFVHRTIAAYFVARHLAQDTEDVSVVVDRRLWSDSAWNDVIAMLGSRRPDDVIDHLLGVGDDPFHLALRMAGRIAADSAVEVDPERFDLIIDRLLTLLPLTGGIVRGGCGQQVREVLGRLVPRMADPTLERVLTWATSTTDDDLRPVLGPAADRPAVRAWALAAVGDGTPAGVRAGSIVDLMATMTDDDRIVSRLIGLLDNSWLRRSVATALSGVVSRDEVRTSLFSATRAHPDGMPGEVFVALGRTDDDEAVDLLLWAARHESPHVRALAARGLVEVAHRPDVRPALAASLTQARAGWSIYDTFDQVLDYADIRQQIVAQVVDEAAEEDLRIAAAGIVAQRRDAPDVGPAMLRAFRAAPEGPLRVAIARTLLGAPWLDADAADEVAGAVPADEPEADPTTPAGRAAILDILATGEDDMAAYRAALRLRDVLDDATVRSAVVTIVRRSSSRHVRRAIADVLAARDDDDIWQPLLEAVSGDADPELRAEALRALAGNLYRDQVAEAAVGALSSDDFAIASAASQIIGARFDEHVASPAALLAICRAVDRAPRPSRVVAFEHLEQRATQAYPRLADDDQRAFVHRVLSRVTRDATCGFASRADIGRLRRCIELAEAALVAGDEPFGSVLIGPDGAVLYEGHNEVAAGDYTRHPELMLAQWAAANLSPQDRASCTVYTSGEHCPMCAAAHAWVGLGKIVFAASSEQLTQWLTEFGAPRPPVLPLSIREVAPDLDVMGPVPELAGEIRDLHRRFHR